MCFGPATSSRGVFELSVESVRFCGQIETRSFAVGHVSADLPSVSSSLPLEVAENGLFLANGTGRSVLAYETIEQALMPRLVAWAITRNLIESCFHLRGNRVGDKSVSTGCKRTRVECGGERSAGRMPVEGKGLWSRTRFRDLCLSASHQDRSA
jgi:hypothetical protein